MQQRQPRLGDILDDYCPRERRVTNHAVVAMVGADVKQTRCTTCDAEHEYKHAKLPRQRRAADTPAALYAQVAANSPKRVAHEHASHDDGAESPAVETLIDRERLISPNGDAPDRAQPQAADSAQPDAPTADTDRLPDPDSTERDPEEGPVHRPLIRASLPRPEGQQPPARPIPEFTIRQPGGRPARFRPRHQRGGGQQGQPFHGGNRGNTNFMGGPPRGTRPGVGRPQGSTPSRLGRRHGPGRNRSK
jgi:hypothetical protein